MFKAQLPLAKYEVKAYFAFLNKKNKTTQEIHS